jgi:exodeoxyribonuclease VII large subunit
LLALERKTARLDTAHARLGALSPAATLERGYAVVRRGEDVVRSTEQVRTGDELSVRVADGAFGAVVE